MKVGVWFELSGVLEMHGRRPTTQIRTTSTNAIFSALVHRSTCKYILSTHSASEAYCEKELHPALPYPPSAIDACACVPPCGAVIGCAFVVVPAHHAPGARFAAWLFFLFRLARSSIAVAVLVASAVFTSDPLEVCSTEESYVSAPHLDVVVRQSKYTADI